MIFRNDSQLLYDFTLRRLLSINLEEKKSAWNHTANMPHLFLISREVYNKTFTSEEYPEFYPEEKLYPSGPKRAGFCIKWYLLVG